MSFFGTNIKKIRQVKGLSQKAFADLFDLNRGVISSYEEGRAEPKIETILKVANYFNLDLDKLLTEILQVNQLASVSDIDRLMFESDKKTDRQEEVLYYKDGSPVQKNILQKILANIDLIHEFKKYPNQESHYTDGDLLFLSLEKAGHASQSVWIDGNGYLHFADEQSGKSGSYQLLYSIVGHISAGKNTTLTDILARLERLENIVLKQL
ncbi:helix-turn-helix domain-containing protein [uncultured Chryseobacterium sp.]|uniref:helix-turn-helix domain-containing protein n=1 Tax=uncultured Chryseobacterium sp. TaxID=259322 RepID=UPI0025CF8201|nr:helix-turn-helix domain-containing protein [uncultured Chryseobacterium sp.]